MSQFYEKISNFRNEISRLQTELVEEIKNNLQPLAAEFFHKYPFVRAIAWTQYTPYFNDGEACEFSVQDTHIFTEYEFPKAEDEDEDDDITENSVYDGVDTWSLSHAKYRKDWVTDEFVKDFKEFMTFQEDEDAMETIFGDHVQVWITSDGIQVDEYDHD